MERLYEVLFSEAILPYEPLFFFERLWEFWYEQDVEGWFLDSIKRISTPSEFREMVLGLHTGVTFSGQELDLKPRQVIGQRILLQMMIAVLKVHGPDLDNPKVRDKDEVILIRALVRQLEIDGYVYRNEALYPSESTVIQGRKSRAI